jgi:murein DD-endopeptidase MepM/ murein hydrolase activator NlpD
MSYQTLINNDPMSRANMRVTRVGSVRPAYWLLTSLLVILAALILLGIHPEKAEATRKLPLQITGIEAYSGNDFPEKISTAEPVAGEAALTTAGEVSDTPPDAGSENWHTIKIKAGDNLADIFSREGLPPQQLHQILDLGGAAHNLTTIYPGQTLRLLTDNESGLIKLEYQIDKLNVLEVRRTGNDFEISTTYHTPERSVTNTSGVIESSLFLAAQKAGLSDNMTMELASMFGWDIDFALDIRKGDKFVVLYDELYLEGEKVGEGHILAATFINQGKTYQAVRYTDKSGDTEYYSPDGRNMRKAFLRTPVEYTRISSGFSLGRMHPILNRIRAHKGVDYAAPIGTPVKVTANGKILFEGKKGGYGNTIIVQHGNKYSTLYGHLSRFSSSLSTGSRVRQGQVIAYVGMTGLATGPHLHYEFRIDGVHHDPLTVKLPDSEPLDKVDLADFRQKAASLIGKLDAILSVQIASSE